MRIQNARQNKKKTINRHGGTVTGDQLGIASSKVKKRTVFIPFGVDVSAVVCSIAGKQAGCLQLFYYLVIVFLVHTNPLWKLN